MNGLSRFWGSSSYQMGALFSLLMLVGLVCAGYWLWLTSSVPVDGDLDRSLVAKLQMLGWIMVVILLLLFALSFGVAYYVATRFERIANTTDRIIATGNLGERLDVDSTWDDLSKLAALLNRMLAELEQRVDGIKSVSDSIAHDLRTPMMRLRAHIESEESLQAREPLLAELDRILQIFQSLLRISSIEAGKLPLAREPVVLSSLVADAVSFYEPLGEEKNITITQALSPVSACLDRDLVFQAVTNLLDNAIKFTPGGGSIHIACNSESERVLIRVSDSGPGIPAVQRERALERFGRLDSSRSTTGSGLGLPLVAAIARRHGGELVLDDAEPGASQPGLCVEMTLPIDIESLSPDAP